MYVLMRIQDYSDCQAKTPLFMGGESLVTAAEETLTANLHPSKAAVRYEVEYLPEITAAEMLNLAEFLEAHSIVY